MIERQKDAGDRVVLAVTTFPNEDIAGQIGTHLVDSQLVACVNMLPGATSIYRWKENVETETEVVGIMKTTERTLEKLEAELQEKHPYDEPEFVVLAVEAGSAGYLGWVREETRVDKPGS